MTAAAGKATDVCSHDRRRIGLEVLDEKLGQLESVRQWSPRVISKLETAIRGADDYDLFRVNPIRHATDKGMSENEAIDLFLYSVKIGLFEMEWHLVCQTCGEVVHSFHTMHRLHPHFTCSVCGMQNEAFMDDHIHVTFTLSQHVRDLAYHHPERLSPRDFFLEVPAEQGRPPTNTNHS